MEKNADFLKDPTKFGYYEVYFSKKKHNQLFPNSKTAFGFYHRYFISEKEFIIFTFMTFFAKSVNTLCFPLLAIFHGLQNVPEMAKRIKEQWQEKKLNLYLSCNAYPSSKTYHAVCDEIANIHWKK